MITGIVGLGLIGGSFARAYKKEGNEVLAFDTDKNTLEYAILDGVVDKKLEDDDIANCDIIIVCTYPEAAMAWMEEKGAVIGKKPIVMDSCGTKQVIVSDAMALAKKYGFTYVGGHPMAGTQFSGFKYSKADLFEGAPMVICPPNTDDPVFQEKVRKLLAPVHFGSITVTTAAEHDRIIAYTSQLAHVVSSAYIKSPSSRAHKGISAGSYKDMTRVARLSPKLWTELFLSNADNLTQELDTLIDNLEAYRKAIKDRDSKTLMQLLDEGRKIKEEVDG